MKIIKIKIQFVIELLYIKKEIDLTHGAKLNFNWYIYIYIYDFCITYSNTKNY